MHFVLKIKVDNAAFKPQYDESDNPDDLVTAESLVDVLTRVADILDAGQPFLDEDASGTIMDLNGNDVGKWEVTG